MWRLIFTKRAERDLLGLEKSIAKRIVEKLEETAANPEHHFQKLVAAPYYKLRIGDYRAIVVLVPQQQLIDVRRIGHRRNIYKNI